MTDPFVTIIGTPLAWWMFYIACRSDDAAVILVLAFVAIVMTLGAIGDLLALRKP